jgi:hypothetical protein
MEGNSHDLIKMYLGISPEGLWETTASSGRFEGVPAKHKPEDLQPEAVASVSLLSWRSLKLVLHITWI